MMQTSSLEVRDFHGGITDNPTSNEMHKYQKADNLVVTINKKLIVRPGSVINDATYPRVPANTRIGSLYEDGVGDLLIQNGKKVHYINAGWQTLQGPSSNEALTAGDVDSKVSWTEWNNHVYVTNDSFAPVSKIYTDSGGTKRVRTAGLPALASAPTVTAGAAGAASYIYSFLYYYTYTVGTVTFEDFGAVTQVSVSSTAAPDATTIPITAIPVIANSTTYNYDTTVIKCKIYRTQDGGTSSTYIGEVTNGTTIYDDSASDASIASNVALYIDGGILDNGSPPLAKYIHVSQGACWYANIKSGTELLSNRVIQSIIDDPDSVPAANYVDLEEPITGISSYLDRVIVLCVNSAYRLDGTYNELGQGGPTFQKIENIGGCVDNNSIVQIPGGIVYAGNDGFYFTNGFTGTRISEEFNTTYAGLDLTACYGILDDENKRVWWTVQDSASNNDKCFILDTRWGISPTACFTTASNGANFYPSALIYYNKHLLRADERGYIFKHDEDYFSDPLVDTSKSVADWDTATIFYDYLSCATSFGDTAQRKFVPKVLVQAKSDTNMALQVVSYNDLGRQVKELKPIRYSGVLVWGDPMPTWGDADLIWGDPGWVEEQRRFHSESLRCSYKQIGITSGYVVIYNSDALCTATVDAVTRTAVLTDTVNYVLPEDIIGYYISFENDAYSKQYIITARTATTVTFTDADGSAPTGEQKWLIKGYPKNEVVSILSYNIYYAPLGQTQTDYSASSVRGNE